MNNLSNYTSTSLVAEFLFHLTHYKLSADKHFDAVFHNMYAHKPHEIAGVILKATSGIDLKDNDRINKVFQDLIENFEERMREFKSFYYSPETSDSSRDQIWGGVHTEIPSRTLKRNWFSEIFTSLKMSLLGVHPMGSAGAGRAYPFTSMDGFILDVRNYIDKAKDIQDHDHSTTLNEISRKVFSWEEFIDKSEHGDPSNVLRIISRTFNRVDGYTFQALELVMDELEKTKDFTKAQLVHTFSPL